MRSWAFHYPVKYTEPMYWCLVKGFQRFQIIKQCLVGKTFNSDPCSFHNDFLRFLSRARLMSSKWINIVGLDVTKINLKYGCVHVNYHNCLLFTLSLTDRCWFVIMNHHWLYMTTKLIVVNDNQRCFLQLQFWRSPTLPSTVRQGPLFTLIQHSLHLKEPKTLSLIPGGFQTPAPSVGHLCAGRDLAIHSLQDTLLLMAFTETKLTRVAYQKFLLLQCHTRMPRRYYDEWKVMNFRQLISKEITHKMQEAVINEADKKNQCHHLVSMPFFLPEFIFHTIIFI